MFETWYILAGVPEFNYKINISGGGTSRRTFDLLDQRLVPLVTIASN